MEKLCVFCEGGTEFLKYYSDGLQASEGFVVSHYRMQVKEGELNREYAKDALSDEQMSGASGVLTQQHWEEL